MTGTIRTNKKYRFLFWLGTAFLLALLLIAAGLGYLWKYLARYEANTPDAALRRYVQLLSEGDYDEIYDTSGFQPDSFNDKNAYLSYVKNIFQGDLATAVFIKKPEKNPDMRVYDCYLNQRLAGVLELLPSSDGPAWSARARVSYRAPFAVTTPVHVQVQLNGAVLPPESAHPLEALPERLCGVQTPELIPKLVRYEVGGLLNPPELTVQKPDGTPCAIEENAEGFAITAPVSAADENECKQLLEQAAKTYAAFITRDATFAVLSQYLYDKTEFYSAIKGFSNIWYIAHDSFEYRNVVSSELTELSPEEFTGKVSFDYVVKTGGKEHVYPSSYQLSFLKIEGAWKLVNLITL